MTAVEAAVVTGRPKEQPKKAAKRRRRRNNNKSETAVARDVGEHNEAVSEKAKEAKADNVQVEYVAAPILLDERDPAYEEFKKIIEHFATGGVSAETENGDVNNTENTENEIADMDNQDKQENTESDTDSDNESATQQPKLSRKQAKKLQRLTVAELKQLVSRPEVVDWVDVTASDPKLLVLLKSYRNSVPVPVHWSQKRKYLQGKRGIEKRPFELPSFIKATGIAEMRESIKEKEDAQKLKQKARERLQPKMGKLEIDYQKLHDAFFKWQTKPKLSRFGELYYEGKEFETATQRVRPGVISEALREALSMPPLAPPPWLINMQRYGPPPGYPGLRIPGLNAPIPAGAQWGFHPGGWGKPPTDEWGRPLYGDVFGVTETQQKVEVDQTLWGEPESEESESEEEEEQEEEEEEERGDLEVDIAGMETPSTIVGGLETPDVAVDVRKRRRGDETDERGVGMADEDKDTEPKQLYRVLDERQTSVEGQFMGSERVYDVQRDAPLNVAKPSSGIDTGITTSSGTETERERKRQKRDKDRKKEFKF